MTDYQMLERNLRESLQFDRRPVAVTFLDTPPGGVAQFSGAAPSGCTFWKLAAAGQTFYTVPADHYNCAIGSYTHNIPLPPERAHELTDTLGLMGTIGYVRMEEVPGIPQLPTTPAAIVYAPLGDTPVDPDVVLFCGQPGRLMLLEEAAIRAGVSSQLSTLARPTCMALPAALRMGMVASTGCVGNRVYTDIDDADFYIAVPGRDLTRIAEHLPTTSGANHQLFEYHQDRRQKLTAG